MARKLSSMKLGTGLRRLVFRSLACFGGRHVALLRCRHTHRSVAFISTRCHRATPVDHFLCSRPAIREIDRKCPGEERKDHISSIRRSSRIYSINSETFSPSFERKVPCQSTFRNHSPVLAHGPSRNTSHLHPSSMIADIELLSGVGALNGAVDIAIAIRSVTDNAIVTVEARRYQSLLRIPIRLARVWR